MASALYSTPSVPSEAPDQRSGPGVAAAPLAPVDATLEPSNPPPPPVLQALVPAAVAIRSDENTSSQQQQQLMLVAADTESAVAEHPSAIVVAGSTMVCSSQAPDGDAMDEATVRAVFYAHFERGEPSDYVQLKDVAVVLEVHPTCHQRLCYKAGTRVSTNEALATVVSRVAGVDVRNVQVTMPGQVKVRGPIKGFRKVAQQADAEERSSKTPRLDPALELEALRERVRALQLENEHLQQVAAAAEQRAAAAELRAVAAEARLAVIAAPPKPTRTEAEPAACSVAEAARISCPSPPASSTESSSGDSGLSGDSDAAQGAPQMLALAHSLVQQVVRFERTGTVALVEAYDQVGGLHTVSASGRSWREALVGRSAAAFTLVPPGSVAQAEPLAQPSPLIAKLEGGLVALGHWDAFPVAGEGESWCAVPPGMDLEQWTRVLDAAMRPSAVAIMLVTGTLVPARLHTAVLHLIAERLPGSSVIALNVGELEADAAAYDALASAIVQPSCVLGHLYLRDPVSEVEHERKRRVRGQLRRNCAKPGYLAQLVRDEVWALKGAHCWHNFSDALRSRALAWAASNGPPASAALPALPSPPRRALRAPCPVRSGVARVGLGRAHQAEVPVWPHGDSPKAPQAAATASLERGDQRVALCEGDELRKQRVAFNARLLVAEPRRRWLDAGVQRIALGPTHARELLAYVRDPANRDARGRLRLDDAKGTLLGGYGNYRATHAVEGGTRHSETEQARHTLLLSNDLLDLARGALPGLDALVNGGLRQLPEVEADGRALVPLHGHILDQGSGTARFADHQDTEEEVAVGARAPDRRVVYTVVIALSDGGDTAMRILGQEELAFTGEAGSGVAFRSALWHRTERASAGVWKLALFYGYLL